MERSAPGRLACLVRQAAEAGFAKVVITGGEPLMHLAREALLDALYLHTKQTFAAFVVRDEGLPVRAAFTRLANPI